MKWNFFNKLTPKSRNQMFINNVSEMDKIRDDVMKRAKDILSQAYAVPISRIISKKNLNKKNNYEMESIQKQHI